jgi:hypothetical protein
LRPRPHPTPPARMPIKIPKNAKRKLRHDRRR